MKTDSQDCGAENINASGSADQSSLEKRGALERATPRKLHNALAEGSTKSRAGRPRRMIPWLDTHNGVFYVHWHDETKKPPRTRRRSTRTRDPEKAKKWYVWFLSEETSTTNVARTLAVSAALEHFRRKPIRSRCLPFSAGECVFRPMLQHRECSFIYTIARRLGFYFRRTAIGFSVRRWQLHVCQRRLKIGEAIVGALSRNLLDNRLERWGGPDAFAIDFLVPTTRQSQHTREIANLGIAAEQRRKFFQQRHTLFERHAINTPVCMKLPRAAFNNDVWPKLPI